MTSNYPPGVTGSEWQIMGDEPADSEAVEIIIEGPNGIGRCHRRTYEDAQEVAELMLLAVRTSGGSIKVWINGTRYA